MNGHKFFKKQLKPNSWFNPFLILVSVYCAKNSQYLSNDILDPRIPLIFIFDLAGARFVKYFDAYKSWMTANWENYILLENPIRSILIYCTYHKRLFNLKKFYLKKCSWDFRDNPIMFFKRYPGNRNIIVNLIISRYQSSSSYTILNQPIVELSNLKVTNIKNRHTEKGGNRFNR